MIDFIICGTRKDPHVRQVEKVLLQKSVKVLVLDYLNSVEFSFHQSEVEPFNFSIDNQSISRSVVVWNRLKLREPSPYFFNDDKKGRAKLKMNQWLGFYNTIFSFFSDTTVNSIESITRCNKPYQHYIANQVGLNFPHSLITNSRGSAIEFEEVEKNIVTKSLGTPTHYSDEGEPAGLLMTMAVQKSTLKASSEDSYKVLPHFFQKNIQKAYELRIVYINEKIYAFKINSQQHEFYATDWRRGNSVLEFIPYELPAKIVSKLKSFMKRMGLFSGSIDLIVDQNSDYWFLECNQDGQWMWLDSILDGEISTSYADSFINLINK